MMSRKTEGALRTALFTVIASIVGAAFYFTGAALGVWFAVIAALLLWSVFVERTRQCPRHDDSLDMVDHPAWQDREGNIWHKRG